MDLLDSPTTEFALPDERTQRLAPISAPAARPVVSDLMPLPRRTGEPVAPMERLATAADYVGSHRKPESRLARAWSFLRNLVVW